MYVGQYEENGGFFTVNVFVLMWGKNFVKASLPRNAQIWLYGSQNHAPPDIKFRAILGENVFFGFYGDFQA